MNSENLPLPCEILPDAEALARRGAALVAAEARAAVAARGRFALAVSGGRTPWRMLRELAQEVLPWSAVHLFQVDERAAPPGDAARNLVHLEEALAARLAALHLYPMPVEDFGPEAARRYRKTLAAVAGEPPVLDLVHLGLGADGHTASLIPGDPVLAEDRDVALSGSYQGWPRLTLAFPALDRARRVLWVVSGADKAAMLARLRVGDATIPAGRVKRQNALLLADAEAAGAVGEKPPRPHGQSGLKWAR